MVGVSGCSVGGHPKVHFARMTLKAWGVKCGYSYWIIKAAIVPKRARPRERDRKGL